MLNGICLFLFKVWEGLNVVKTGRVMLGETNPADSKPGTIRGDFCIQVGRFVLSLLPVEINNSIVVVFESRKSRLLVAVLL